MQLRDAIPAPTVIFGEIGASPKYRTLSLLTASSILTMTRHIRTAAVIDTACFIRCEWLTNRERRRSDLGSRTDIR